MRALANADAKSSNYIRSYVALAPALIVPTAAYVGPSFFLDVNNWILYSAWARENDIFSLFGPDDAAKILASPECGAIDAFSPFTYICLVLAQVTLDQFPSFDPQIPFKKTVDYGLSAIAG